MMPSQPVGLYDVSSMSGTHGLRCSCTSAARATKSTRAPLSRTKGMRTSTNPTARAHSITGRHSHVPSSRQFALAL